MDLAAAFNKVSNPYRQTLSIAESILISQSWRGGVESLCGLHLWILMSQDEPMQIKGDTRTGKYSEMAVFQP